MATTPTLPLDCPTDLNVRGTLTAKTLALKSACIGDAMLLSGLSGSKITHENVGPGAFKELFDPATSVTATTKMIMRAVQAGSLLSVGAIVYTVATGADRTVTIDLHKATAGGVSFATVLSATFGFTNGSVVNTIVAGTVSTTPYAAGDLFKIIVTVAGAAGNQALGLGIILQVNENPT